MTHDEPTLLLIDNNKGEIIARYDGVTIRSWHYGDADEQAARMFRAREFSEGWFQAFARFAPVNY